MCLTEKLGGPREPIHYVELEQYPAQRKGLSKYLLYLLLFSCTGQFISPFPLSFSQKKLTKWAYEIHDLCPLNKDELIQM